MKGERLKQGPSAQKTAEQLESERKRRMFFWLGVLGASAMTLSVLSIVWGEKPPQPHSAVTSVSSHR